MGCFVLRETGCHSGLPFSKRCSRWKLATNSGALIIPLFSLALGFRTPISLALIKEHTLNLSRVPTFFVYSLIRVNYGMLESVGDLGLAAVFSAF